jgi:hypothetical protein
VDKTEATQGPFTRSREALYRSIDWALDITGIPARLFRLDPESQAVVTRDRVTAEGRPVIDIRSRGRSLQVFG